MKYKIENSASNIANVEYEIMVKRCEIKLQDVKFEIEDAQNYLLIRQRGPPYDLSSDSDFFSSDSEAVILPFR